MVSVSVPGPTVATCINLTGKGVSRIAFPDLLRLNAQWAHAKFNSFYMQGIIYLTIYLFHKHIVIQLSSYTSSTATAAATAISPATIAL